MLKQLCLFCALIPVLAIAADGIKNSVRLDALHPYVYPKQGSKYLKIKPDKNYPLGRFQFLADKSKPNYRVEAYFHDPATLEQYKRYTVKFTVSDDVTLAAQLSFGLKPKNKKFGWYGSFKGIKTAQFPLIPGNHQLTVEIDLKQQKLPDLGYVCPIINVSKLTQGTVTIHSIEVETMASSYEPPKPPPVPQVPGLAGFTVQKNALTHFQWDGEISLTKFVTRMNYTTLGLDIIDLTPANPAVAWQWPDGDTILAEYKNGIWQIRTGEKPGKYSASYTVKGDKITTAATAEGVIFRSAGKDIFVPGGLNSVGRALLVKNGTPALKVRQLRIIDQAMAMIVVEEAERTLKNASVLFNENENYISNVWNGNNRLRAWVNSFVFHEKSLADRKAQLNKSTGNYLPVILSVPSMRDRLASLVYLGVLSYWEPTGYWGDVFNKRYFDTLDGQPQVQAALRYAEKVESLVNRARRVSKASFTEGVKADGLELSAGFARHSLTHVFRYAGATGKLTKEVTLDIAAGETESAQLVLSTARYGVNGLSINCRAVTPNAPAVKIYSMEYIRLMAVPNPQLPLSLGGDKDMPDVLKNYTPGQKFAMESYCNQPIQIDLRSTKNAKAGIYEYVVEVLKDDKVVASLPLKVKVRNFSFGDDYIPTLGGWRQAAFHQWYGDKGKTARRNLITTMLEHRLNPTDLYFYSPTNEDTAWAIEQGLTGVNLGRQPLQSLAHPDPRMVKFIELYGSNDGENFTRIPAEAKISPRPLKCGTDEHDLLITPKGATGKYKYLKVHYSETRDWDENLPTEKFFLLSSSYGDPLIVTTADGKSSGAKNIHVMRQDMLPARTGLKSMRPLVDYWFDNLRNKENLASVVFEAGNSDLTSIRLVNRSIESTYNDLMKKYNFIRSLPGGDKIDIYLYGFDESRMHVNDRIRSAFANAKKILPQDIIIVSTAAELVSAQDVFDNLDVHCPANGFALTRLNQRIKRDHGTKFWTYVGGGGYYPMANFERVDQPLIFARAFTWEMIAFDFIEGMLYWDFHMWRYNSHLKGNNDIDWSLWNPTHNTNNGMGAIFYPGPNGEMYPSRRATALRDGLEDVLAVRLAKRLIAAKPAAEQAALKAELQKICDIYCTGMSVYCKDIDTMDATRTRLYDFIEKLQK